ncbi:carboxylesterase/lipase family protein [Aestuariibaculum sediminum]|uniref:Carboxylic ester hydrolase n=1 Tax=Aestuariibaculum sediminum TaxID=2770637 RepID=A0A8J6U7X0_9FLAO|nr:carboxylesterase family protein [Aestuariibaculum sediminum]MBD0832545.1 carboxylesterase family protein [Aestuariibaculum sediminum]
MKAEVLLLFFILSFFSCSSEDPSLVEVDQGVLKGEVEGDLRVFKGIPFAQPPLGNLRWKVPQAPEKWKGVRDATQFAPSPFQRGNPPAGKSEDCLYLNVWTRAKSDQDKLPVMVWIYGGGFGAGTTADPVCSGVELTKEGVVVVAIAYRVGILGFLAHPELSAESENSVSGNYGLLDQIAGLQWVQKNIEAFGGDPNKVTIFGESAGGISVSMLCASPLAKGLFHGAISQSGGSFGPTRATTYPGENMKTLAMAHSDGITYAERSGRHTIAALRQMPVDSLPVGRGWPIVDGYVIPDIQHTLYEKGQYNDVPVIIGYNSDEGASFTWSPTPEDFVNRVHRRYGQFADTLLGVYPIGVNKITRTARDLNRDAAFGWQTWVWAELQSQTGKSPVYYYYFDQHPDYPEDSPKYGYGSPHGQEVAYVFGTLNKIKELNDFTHLDSSLSEKMIRYWTNFSKYGNPNGEGLPQWLPYTNSNPKVMYLDSDPNMGAVPDEKAIKVLNSYFKWRMISEGQKMN